MLKKQYPNLEQVTISYDARMAHKHDHQKDLEYL